MLAGKDENGAALHGLTIPVTQRTHKVLFVRQPFQRLWLHTHTSAKAKITFVDCEDRFLDSDSND